MTMVIRAAQLFDGESVVVDPVVVCQGDTIESVGSGPGGPVDFDLGEATLLPGLIDAHVHFAFDASTDPATSAMARTDEEMYAAMPAIAKRMLAAGITVARDLGDRNYLTLRLRDELATNPVAGPRILSAGPALTTLRGHLWFFGGECGGVESIRAAVAEHARRGVDVIKVMATGGELTEGTHSWVPQFSVAELTAAREAAHAAGLKITAHAHGALGIANAISARVDSIQHCSFMTEDGIDLDHRVLSSAIEAGITVSVTTGVRPGLPVRPRIAALLPKLQEAIRTIWSAGARVVLTSDCGVGPSKPHDVLPFAVAQVVASGAATPVQALRSVTSLAADECGIGSRHGRVRPGSSADFLAVKGDVLSDASLIHSVAAVFRAGERVL